jgi:molybdenum ABC transporter molybdate-binding protein
MIGAPLMKTTHQPERGIPAGAWSVGLRVWLARAGRAVVGQGRLELLRGIEQHGSISAAARRMGMSYRRAWELVRDMNDAAGEPLVLAAVGGADGGGAQLTALGRQLADALEDLQQHLAQSAGLPRFGGAAGTLHLLAALSLDEVIGRLLTDFAVVQPGVCVRALYGASDELADHLLAGAPGDVIVSADPRQLDRLEQAGLLRAEERIVLAGNGLAAVAALGREVEVRRPADLKRDGLRVALASGACPLGYYTRRYLESLHLYEPLLRRAVLLENSRGVLTAVRAGQADVGLAYSSDAGRAADCRTLFRVRRQAEPIRYAAAVLHRGRNADSASAVLDFLASSTAARRFRECGFEPTRR